MGGLPPLSRRIRVCCGGAARHRCDHVRQAKPAGGGALAAPPGGIGMDGYRWWGGGRAEAGCVARPRAIAEARAALGARNGMRALAYGCGRSYGDVALNPDGLLIDCRGLDRFIDFDPDTGILAC